MQFIQFFAFLCIGSESKANFLCVPESKFAMFDCHLKLLYFFAAVFLEPYIVPRETTSLEYPG